TAYRVMYIFSHLTSMICTSFEITSSHNIRCIAGDSLWILHHEGERLSEYRMPECVNRIITGRKLPDQCQTLFFKSRGCIIDHIGDKLCHMSERGQLRAGRFIHDMPGHARNIFPVSPDTFGSRYDLQDAHNNSHILGHGLVQGNQLIGTIFKADGAVPELSLPGFYFCGIWNI